jgi:tight adherence protein B
MEDPLGSEFGLVSDEVSYGAELTDALDAMADRWDLEDIRMFVVSLSVQIETGGNLAEILENLGDVIRARASLYLKVRALSSEGRMTGWILSVLPIITFIGMFMVNPKFYLDVAQDSIFIVGLPSLIGLYLLGVFWIRKLVDIKV